MSPRCGVCAAPNCGGQNVRGFPNPHPTALPRRPPPPSTALWKFARVLGGEEGEGIRWQLSLALFFPACLLGREPRRRRIDRAAGAGRRRTTAGIRATLLEVATKSRPAGRAGGSRGTQRKNTHPPTRLCLFGSLLCCSAPRDRAQQSASSSTGAKQTHPPAARP